MTWELWMRLKPVSTNEAVRMHRYALADVKRTYRNAACVMAKQAKIPALDHATVELTIYPRTKRRRDGDNWVSPLLKSLCDGLVDAGVCVDDTPDLMTKAMPIIAGPDERGLFCLRVSG